MDRSKAIKLLSEVTVEEMDAMDEATLKKTIVDASSAMKTAKEELEANPQYIELKESLQACTQGKKDLDARQKARIAYSLELLEAKGK